MTQREPPNNTRMTTTPFFDEKTFLDLLFLVQFTVSTFLRNLVVKGIKFLEPKCGTRVEELT